MGNFLEEDFLLRDGDAAYLYHEVAKKEPIFDYHCHLVPREIAENGRFPDLASAWLGGDHYKWRQMRWNGIREELITGSADPYDKFRAWAATVPRLPGNPLYHWTHLELRRYFGIYDRLNPESAPAIWKAANEKLASDPDLTVFGIFKKFNVYAVGTTDDPADGLEWHEKVRGKTPTRVLPSFRPDRAVNIEKPDFAAYVEKLGVSAGVKITRLDDLLAALRGRIDFFHKTGCRISDHALDAVPFATASGDPELARPGEVGFALWEKEAAETFARALSGKKPDASGREAWKTFLLYFLAKEYSSRDWAMQIHVGALRNNNAASLAALGPDSGYDAVHDLPVAEKLSRFMDLLDFEGKLPKTILYSLNVKDLYSMATLAGCFQGERDRAREPVPGKIQLGSGWWFLDHLDGMEAQMRILGNVGLLSRFIGMLTDSRSFLSYPRHEYFRRLLCSVFGKWESRGELPGDTDLLGGIVRDISFGNAKRYFNAG